MCLHTMEKYDKVENLNIKNNYETTKKNKQIKRKQT